MLKDYKKYSHFCCPLGCNSPPVNMTCWATGVSEKNKSINSMDQLIKPIVSERFHLENMETSDFVIMLPLVRCSMLVIYLP